MNSLHKDKMKAEKILQEEIKLEDALRKARLDYAKAEAEIKLEFYKIGKRMSRELLILESVRFILILSLLFLTVYLGASQ